MSTDLRKGMADGDLYEGTAVHGEVDGEPVVLVRDGGRVHALGDRTTHTRERLVHRRGLSGPGGGPSASSAAAPQRPERSDNQAIHRNA